MASRPAILGALILHAATIGCVYYGLDVEGKACNPPGRPCPPGYRCVDSESADGGKICKPGSTDGGSGDCTDGETECSEGLLRICRSGEWTFDECPEGEYCFDANQSINAGCVAECQDSSDCEEIVENYYCDTVSHRCQERGDCEPLDVTKCSLDGTQVLYCNPETGEDELVATCTGLQYCHRSPPPVQCMDFCDDDTGCVGVPGTSCNLSSRRCVDIAPCLSDQACPDPDEGTSICVGTPEGSPGACVVEPVEECTVSGGGDPVLTCYEETIEVSTGPATCTLEGRVVMFFSRGPIPVGQDSQGLVVRLHTLDNILKGITSGPYITAELTAVDLEWQYRMQEVPTNTAYVMDVHCDFDTNPSCAFDTLYTFEVYIRAEECVGPDFIYSLGAPALYKLNYLAYTEVGGLTKDPEKGLLFGWLKDCQGYKLMAGTGGISMAHDLLYYLPTSGIPDLAAESTLAPGFFAAANVLPIRGVASALVLNISPQSLRSREVRVFPSAGSLVIFESPKKPIE